METSYSIIQRESEYRILLAPADTSVLSEGILDVLTERNIDVSELMIERISGESTTDQDVLHDITGWVADIFANNTNLIIYYSCDVFRDIQTTINNEKHTEINLCISITFRF